MRILTLPELVPGPEHMLWWLTERQYFASDILNCGSTGYSHHLRIPKDMRDGPAGTRRYSVLFENLRDMLIREFQAQIRSYKGQTRFVIEGPGHCQVQGALRKATPAVDGFNSKKAVGPATEQLSFLTRGTFQFDNGMPSTIGLLLVHDFTPNKPGYMSMWLAHEWWAPKGSHRIYCKECALLGDIQYRYSESDIEPTGDSPENIL